MNGPAHYREGDLILTGDADPCSYGCPHTGCPHETVMIARAQAHLTAALVVAILTVGGNRINPAGRHEWLKATDPDYAAEQAAEATR